MTQGHYLLATLGGKPQVITTALDKLLAQSIPITKLILFHTASGSDRLRRALVDLRWEIDGASYYQPPIAFEPIPLQGADGPLQDVITPEDIEAGFRTIYRHMLQLKQQGIILHLCPAGGRKTMTLFSMAAAQLLFEEGDRFWHVVAGGEFLNSERLHPHPDDEAQLIQVPLLRWLNLSPALLHKEIAADPYRALRHSQQALQDAQHRRLGDFLSHWLSPAERQVAELVIREGLENRAVGERLGRSSSTVANQLTSVYAKLDEFLQLEPDARVNRHMLVATFATYFARPS